MKLKEEYRSIPGDALALLLMVALIAALFALGLGLEFSY